jgi:hypothetical protein
MALSAVEYIWVGYALLGANPGCAERHAAARRARSAAWRPDKTNGNPYARTVCIMC